MQLNDNYFTLKIRNIIFNYLTLSLEFEMVFPPVSHGILGICHPCIDIS